MNQRLLHPLRDRAHGRRRRGIPPMRPAGTAEVRDRALERAREAGGPIDHAAYSCCCGLLFSAPVSTTVVCPHCGADQAW